jgi:hypothetical protein
MEKIGEPKRGGCPPFLAEPTSGLVAFGAFQIFVLSTRSKAPTLDGSLDNLYFNTWQEGSLPLSIILGVSSCHLF